jgi:hypothetical protein
MKSARNRRMYQLREAALNLGMSEQDASFYAARVCEQEEENGEWRVTPRSAEGLANDQP